MRALRTGIVALIVTGFATSTFAGDLQQSIAKAVEQQPQERAPSKSSATYVASRCRWSIAIS